jgi:hypothetical protein
VIEGSEVGAFSVVIDGLTVRFKENRFWVEAIVEGQLTRKRLSDLQLTTLALLERLDSAQYEIEGADQQLPAQTFNMQTASRKNVND